MQEALALWEDRQQSRAQIVVDVDVSEASVAKGEGRIITQESVSALADEMKQRGRDRLAAEHRAAAVCAVLPLPVGTFPRCCDIERYGRFCSAME